MKKFEKRVISVALIVALVATMVTLSPKMQEGSVTHAATITNTGTAVRGAVEELSQLPQYGVENWKSLQRGTEARPFVVLEIVPYKEFAEIGFMIGGCEPVDINRMLLNQYSLSSIENMGYMNLTRNPNRYLFQDEILYMYRNDQEIYDALTNDFADGSDSILKKLTGSQSIQWIDYMDKVYGYYEQVADGTGNYNITITPVYQEVPNEDESDIEGETENDNDGEIGSEEGAGNGEETGSDDEIGSDDDASEEQYASNGGILTLTFEIGDSVPVISLDEVQDDNEAVSGEEIIVNDGMTFDGSIVLDGNVILDGSEDDEDNTADGGIATLPADNMADGGIVTLPADNGIMPMINDAPRAVALGTTSVLIGYTVNIEKNIGHGNWIWHSEGNGKTAGNTYLEDLVIEGVDISDTIYNVAADTTKLYTYRNRDENNKFTILYNVADEYKNHEFFLTQSMGLGNTADDDRVKNYSIVVKTITPGELNKNSDWVDYADLVYLHSTPTRGNTDKFIVDYNELWNGGNAYNGNYDSKKFASDDLDWSTTLKLYNKVTASSNYAGIILDETIYKGDGGAVVNNDNSKKVDITVYDWNFNEYFDDYGNKVTELYGIQGCNNNIYKLYVMLLCMNSNLFHQLYLNEDNPLIDKDGNYTMQTGDARSYWCMETFLLVPPNIVFSQYGNSLYQYWDSEAAYRAYHFCSGAAAVDHWVQDHVFVIKGDEITNNGRFQAEFGVNGKFQDFNDFCKQDGNHPPTVAEAVKYILNAGDGPYGEGMTLNILDIEPSVGLDKNSQPNWTLTENYLRWLIPSFAGKIKITHQTTAHFIGMAEDLNAEYQMIFMGLDANAYNLRSMQVGGRQMQVPAWNDKAMYDHGYIYVHLGDMMFSTEKWHYVASRSVKWLSRPENATADTWTDIFLRFPGNDISRLKKAELENFMKSGRAVVAEEYLYNLQYVIDPNSVVYKFVKESKEAKLPLFSVSQADLIDKTVRASSSEAVTFTHLPELYNGSTPDHNATITNPNYLPTNSGRAQMVFTFDVAAEKAGEYSYSIYVDQDKNSRFEDNEAIVSGRAANVGTNTYTYQVGPSTVGLVQWKIEVYKTNNPEVRFVKTGCSAVRKTSTSTDTRKTVKVLQVMPNNGATNLNLETDATFQMYIRDLQDYDLKIHAVEWNEFSACFTNRGFSYDYTKEIEEGVNPVNEASLGTLRDGTTLDSYNMFVFGFADAYGQTIVKNDYGQVDYIRYFLDQGKSILFTHDLSSVYNVEKDKIGYTVNALMRDLMGMNRYGALSVEANNTGNPNELNRLREYQGRNPEKYDTLEWTDAGGNLQISAAAHGYTYFAMKRLGWDGDGVQNVNHTIVGNDGRGGNWVCRIPYRYLLTSPQGYTMNQGGDGGTGFNNDNDYTTKAAKVNEGQITTYPYKISDILTVSTTHGQWYALSPEDPEVTVWYCLTTDDSAVLKANLTPTGDNRGSSITYGVSPNDTMNTYYIYSKGNIFYSGVGHSPMTGDPNKDPQDMEVKLFVNTMIAAANSSFDPPIVEVTNDESVLTGSGSDYLEYNIEIVQNFDDLGAAYFSSNVTYSDSDTYTVEFTPVDYNLVTTDLTCTIQVGTGGDYIDTVRTASGAVINADPVTHELKLQNRQDYTLIYTMSYMNNDDTRTITFKLKNDRVAGYGTTDLRMSLQPLFPLD